MTRRIISLVFFAVLVVFAPNTAANSDPVLPADVAVEAPSTIADAHLATFLGVWIGGNWSGLLKFAVVVERILNEREVQVIYGHGDSSTWNITTSRWTRVVATYDQAKRQLVVPLANGGVMTCWLAPEGLATSYVVDFAPGKPFISSSTLTRLDPWVGNAPVLPDDLRVTPVGDASPVIKQLSAVWRGTWGGVLPALLAVERIEGSVVHAVYAWGRTMYWRIPKGGSIRLQGTFDEVTGRITLKFPSGVTATFTNDSNGLTGTWTPPKGLSSQGRFLASADHSSGPR